MGENIMRHIEIKDKVVYFKNRSYPIIFVPKKEFRKRMHNLWYKIFGRGYTTRGVVYIRKRTWIGLEKLILHEIGHILGYGHTWRVYIMHPSWIGRWIWKWNKNDSL
jgi:acetyltransferase-like isoleucine patch superfamily enzyme